MLDKYQNSYGQKFKNSDESSENGSDVCLTKEEIRAKIVEEIVSTERDYVQNLKDIVEVDLIKRCEGCINWELRFEARELGPPFRDIAMRKRNGKRDFIH